MVCFFQDKISWGDYFDTYLVNLHVMSSAFRHLFSNTVSLS